ncbi:MAG: hypothetical protein JXA91_03270 [Candidatus Thermoplasmatota archaeon]|nr:hypothetical protein [Candidatus Thermoplasmatota archaeon]
MSLIKTNSDKLVDIILQRYTPSFHYLRSFERIDERNILGKFLVSGSAHVADREMFHLAITETQMCLNQFFQLQMAYLLEKGYFEGVNPIKFKDYWPNSDEYLFVVDQHIRFKRHIEPNKMFLGRLKLVNEKVSRRGYYHINFDFDFDEKAHYGTLRLAFDPEGLAREIEDGDT